MSQARGKAALIHKEENIEHGIKADCVFCGACLVAQMVKNLPAMPETWVQSLGQEDLLEKRMTTHSSILAWTEEPSGLESMESQRVRHE